MFWRYEVEGQEDEAAMLQKNVTEYLNNYMDDAKQFGKTISKVNCEFWSYNSQ